MQTRYPGADWRPLGPQTEPGITPRILVFHTMVGYLRSVDTMFRSGGYAGVESTFGVGGPSDGALDGAVWQWQDLGHQADAQVAGNAYANSVETSDGGDPSRPWSAKQLAALVDLTVWWCRQTGSPARLVTSASDHGIGYHRQFGSWNPDNHSCPGDVRLRQLLDVVIPAAARALNPPAPAPPPSLKGHDMHYVITGQSKVFAVYPNPAPTPGGQPILTTEVVGLGADTVNNLRTQGLLVDGHAADVVALDRAR